MREIHGTSNALAVKPYNDLRGGSHVMKEIIERSEDRKGLWQKQFSDDRNVIKDR